MWYTNYFIQLKCQNKSQSHLSILLRTEGFTICISQVAILSLCISMKFYKTITHSRIHIRLFSSAIHSDKRFNLMSHYKQPRAEFYGPFDALQETTFTFTNMPNCHYPITFTRLMSSNPEIYCLKRNQRAVLPQE